MRIISLFLLLTCSSTLFARGNDEFIDTIITPIEINRIFDREYSLLLSELPDIIDREEKISICIHEYVLTRSKSYAKIAQKNLYNLIHNLDDILSSIGGKKIVSDDTSYEERIDALAQLQCNAYYKMGILK